jgi:hypothetical protein
MKWYFYIPGVGNLVNWYWDRRCEREVVTAHRRRLLAGKDAMERTGGSGRLFRPLVEASVKVREAYDILQGAVEDYARSLESDNHQSHKIQ